MFSFVCRLLNKGLRKGDASTIITAYTAVRAALYEADMLGLASELTEGGVSGSLASVAPLVEQAEDTEGKEGDGKDEREEKNIEESSDGSEDDETSEQEEEEDKVGAFEFLRDEDQVGTGFSGVCGKGM